MFTTYRVDALRFSFILISATEIPFYNLKIVK
jgi:hypothetical protein